VRLIPDDRELGFTPYAWLVYSLPYFVGFFTPGATWPRRLLLAAAYLAFLVLYFAGYWHHGRKLVAIIAGLTLLGFALTPINAWAPGFFIYAAAFVAFIDKQRPSFRWLALYLVIVAAYGALTRQPYWFYIPATLVAAIVGAVNVHYAQVWSANAKTRMAQREVERLAKIAERERIARDLHDVLGHTLSVIALKSELAGKLLQRDPSRAAAEIRDVHQVARDALHEVRAAITGYRSAGLAAELGEMRKAFEAAGVALRVEAEPPALLPAQETALALSLREASTNVLRHAQARSCRVRLASENGFALLAIEDDGRGGEAPEGNGLLGMRERLAALGGSLVRDGSQGMKLQIRLPLAGSAAEGA
jgi:two-component system sensor histidine kinase DesK